MQGLVFTFANLFPLLAVHRQFFNNIEDNTQRVYGRYDKVFVQSFEKVFSDMVLFTLKDAKGEVMSCRKIMVSRQLEYLVKMLEAYVQSLPSEIELVSLLDFVKQLKVSGRVFFQAQKSLKNSLFFLESKSNGHISGDEQQLLSQLPGSFLRQQYEIAPREN